MPAILGMILMFLALLVAVLVLVRMGRNSNLSGPGGVATGEAPPGAQRSVERNVNNWTALFTIAYVRTAIVSRMRRGR
jgi:preprotein translocase subunit SecG